MRRTVLYVLLILCLSGGQSIAQESVNVDMDTSYDTVFMPELFDSSIVLDDDDIEPKEPNLGIVTFLNVPEYNNLEERVDRLIHGIEKDLAPEYDHFGYEIRRYMTRIGNSKIYADSDYLIKQIKNTRKASVIVKYWREQYFTEMDEIEAILQEDFDGRKGKISFATRTAFKQNKIKVTTFMIILSAWVDANEAFLMKIFDNFDEYELFYPELFFKEPNLRISLFNDLKLRQTKLKEIRNYPTFAMMVY